MGRVIDTSIISALGGIGILASKIGWRDLISPFFSAKGRGTAEPTWEDTGNGLYAFKFTSGDELFSHLHVPHDYVVGTSAFAHVHFIVDQDMALGDTVTWEIHYSVAKGHHQGDVLNNGSVTFQMTYTADGTELNGEHLIIESSVAQAFDLKETDSIVMLRVKLISSTTSGDVFGIMADLHYISDGTSTDYKEPPFYE